MKKSQRSTQLKKIHKQQEEILEQIQDLKKDISSLLHSLRTIENQIENIESKQPRKKNRLFSFARKKTEKKETETNPLSALGLGDFNIMQMMEILQSPVVQKMLQKFLS